MTLEEMGSLPKIMGSWTHFNRVMERLPLPSDPDSSGKKQNRALSFCRSFGALAFLCRLCLQWILSGRGHNGRTQGAQLGAIYSF